MAETSQKDFYAEGLSDGTRVAMLVEDTSRNKCFFAGLNITCDLFTDSPLYLPY
jgi:hypothetical protein